MNKEFYTKKAQEHFRKYQKALDSENQKKADYHMKEFLTYDKASK